MKNAVITGATSFIGSALVKTLLSRSAECYAIVRPESKSIKALPKNDRLHIIFEDVKNTEAWVKKIPRCEAFFHFAWDGVGAEGRANKDIQKSNTQMAVDCLNAAAKIGCKRFVFSGSQAEYGECAGPITENTPCAPIIEYGKAKFAFFNRATELSNRLGIEYVHLRIFSVYGPGDHPWTLVSKCIDCFSKGESLSLSSCEQIWNFLYIDDAAEAIYQIAACRQSGAFNIGGEKSLPLKAYVEEINKICGGRGVPVYGARSFSEKAIGIDPVITKMKNATGWSQKTPFDEGIRIILKSREDKTL